MAVRSKSAVVTLPSDTQVLVTREFDAPRHLVFRAWTAPELIGRWWCANRGTVKSIEVDLRVGGAWRYLMTANGGFEVGFHGEYREIVPDERIVHTEVFEGAPDHPALTTVTMTEESGITTLRVLTEHADRESRDMHVNSGMEDGLQEALRLLDEVLESLR